MSVVVKAANSWAHLAIAVIGAWLIAAVGFSIIEGVGFGDSLYWSITTMSTVGYGDFSPVTALGKIWSGLFMAFSIFYLVPCAVSNIVDTVRIDEAKFTHEEQEWQEKSLKAIAQKIGVSLDQAPRDY